jgi:large subunit ribosomal protein L10
MSKPLKQLITDNFRRRFEGVDSACVIDLTGMNVGATTRFRRSLCDQSIRVQVVKNSLAARAFKETPLAPLGDSLDGPCALVTGGDSIVDVAKALVQAAKEFKAITLKQAMIDGDPNLMSVEDMAKLRSRGELFGVIALLLSSPGRALAGAVAGPQSRLAGCIRALAEKDP